MRASPKSLTMIAQRSRSRRRASWSINIVVFPAPKKPEMT
jgi:hypothetical protein